MTQAPSHHQSGFLAKFGVLPRDGTLDNLGTGADSETSSSTCRLCAQGGVPVLDFEFARFKGSR